VRQQYIIDPAAPCGLPEITAAVSAAVQIDLQHREAIFSKCLRLQCRHATRFVHFLREGMNVEHSPPGDTAARRVKYAKALAVGPSTGGKKKGFDGHGLVG
jgi:hypothetical protein